MPNPRKIAFIACVNDEGLYGVCLQALRSLEVPPGFEVEFVGVREAASMAAGYNAAMRASDAKYKVYLHQDVFIIQRRFIFDFIAQFHSDAKLGMLGVAGAQSIPESGIWWDGEPRYGLLIEDRLDLLLQRARDVLNSPKPVVALDGVLLATQYDLPWNERIEGFDFYDTAHSLDFVRAGYTVAVAAQQTPSIVHFTGKAWSEDHYLKRLERFVAMEEYRPFFGRQIPLKPC